MANTKNKLKDIHNKTEKEQKDKTVHVNNHILEITWWYARSLHHDYSKLWWDRDAPASKGANGKTKILAGMDNKITVEKLHQVLACWSFQQKSVKWWKKLFIRLSDHTLVNSCILYRMKSNGNSVFYKFMDQVAGSLVISCTDWNCRAATEKFCWRLVSRSHFTYRNSARDLKETEMLQQVCKVHHTRKSTKNLTSIARSMALHCVWGNI